MRTHAGVGECLLAESILISRLGITSTADAAGKQRNRKSRMQAVVCCKQANAAESSRHELHATTGCCPLNYPPCSRLQGTVGLPTYAAVCNTLLHSSTCHFVVEADLKPAHVMARGEAGDPQQYSCCRGCENGCLLLSLGGLGRRRARLKLGLRPSCCAICELPLILCLRLLVGQASFLQTCSRRSHAMLVRVLPQARSTGSYHHRSV